MTMWPNANLQKLKGLKGACQQGNILVNFVFYVLNECIVDQIGSKQRTVFVRIGVWHIAHFESWSVFISDILLDTTECLIHRCGAHAQSIALNMSASQPRSLLPAANVIGSSCSESESSASSDIDTLSAKKELKASRTSYFSLESMTTKMEKKDEILWQKRTMNLMPCVLLAFQARHAKRHVILILIVRVHFVSINGCLTISDRGGAAPGAFYID